MSEVMAGGRLSPADFSYLFKFFKKNKKSTCKLS